MLNRKGKIAFLWDLQRYQTPKSMLLVNLKCEIRTDLITKRLLMVCGEMLMLRIKQDCWLCTATIVNPTFIYSFSLDSTISSSFILLRASFFVGILIRIFCVENFWYCLILYHTIIACLWVFQILCWSFARIYKTRPCKVTFFYLKKLKNLQNPRNSEF